MTSATEIIEAEIARRRAEAVREINPATGKPYGTMEAREHGYIAEAAASEIALHMMAEKRNQAPNWYLMDTLGISAEKIDAGATPDPEYTQIYNTALVNLLRSNLSPKDMGATDELGMGVSGIALGSNTDLRSLPGYEEAKALLDVWKSFVSQDASITSAPVSRDPSGKTNLPMIS